MLLPMLGRSSGVSARNDIGLPVPVLATTYCLPSTAYVIGKPDTEDPM